MPTCGVVVVGRNEGDRLHRSLASVLSLPYPVVYVDSCSTDGSAAYARTTRAIVVELDGSKPLSAARARNEGFEKLLQEHPETEYVQFVDGDCELCAGWIDSGLAAMGAHPDAGIVCGRVLERHPEASVYNLLCSLEWQRPAGEIRACGGIFMTRAEAFRMVDGFRCEVMAAEDDELCLRMRHAGWKILAVDPDMVLHDAAILRFSQWWTRAKRAGMAYAHGAAMHGDSPERHFRRDCQRIWLWAAVLPSVAIGSAFFTRGKGLLLLLAYPALGARIYHRGRQRGWSPHEARVYALFTILGKWPGLLGILHFHHRTRWRKRPVTLIEYKGADEPA